MRFAASQMAGLYVGVSILPLTLFICAANKRWEGIFYYMTDGKVRSR